MQKRLRIVVSDFHLGKGIRHGSGQVNIMEDFHHDLKFREFLDYYSKAEFKGFEVDLIFNGDMFNLIQTDYHGHYTGIITESVSVEKFRHILDGHPIFFDALKKFLANPKHRLTYVVGNHDQEMMWAKTKKMLEDRLDAKVFWHHTYYQVDGMYVEHGNQYEAVNRIDPTMPFLTKNLQEPILNLPWGTLFTVDYLVRLKQQRPYIDKIRPFRSMILWSLLQSFWGTMASLFRLGMYFLSTRFSKNRYRHSSLKITLKMLMEATVFPDLSEAARRILRDPEIHTVVFGHSHVYRHLVVGDGKQYMNTGTWCDIVSMDLESFARRSRLTYVKVEYADDGRPIPQLRHWIGKIQVEDDALAV